MTECVKCGMDYVAGLPEDEKEHQQYHEMIVNGPHTRPARSERVIWSEGNDRITLVTSSSPMSQRRRAAAIAECANREMGYNRRVYREDDPPDDRDVHLFLYHAGSRGIGLLLAELRSHVWRCVWSATSETPHCIELPNHAPIWTVGFIWIHAKHRSVGFATRLFNAAMHYLKLDASTIAWYTPFSEAGERFVRRLCPKSFIIAK